MLLILVVCGCAINESDDRHQGWAVVLIGTGQEIHDGEAGLTEWFEVAAIKFPHWRVSVAPEGVETLLGQRASRPAGLGVDPQLHLRVSGRSHASEALAGWVNAVIDGDANAARKLIPALADYPVVLTRSLDQAGHGLDPTPSGLVASSLGRLYQPVA